MNTITGDIISMEGRAARKSSPLKIRIRGFATSIIPTDAGSEKNRAKFRDFETIFLYSSLLFCPR